MKTKIKKVVMLQLIIMIVISLIGCGLPKESEFQSVVNCAVKLKNMAVDQDSFEISGTCYYAMTRPTDSKNLYEFIFISYKAKNRYGVSSIDVAFFRDGKYVGSESEYSSGTYKYNKDAWETLYFLEAEGVYLKQQFNYKYSKGEVKRGMKKY